jgi:hypothetical protein
MFGDYTIFIVAVICAVIMYYAKPFKFPKYEGGKYDQGINASIGIVAGFLLGLMLM